MNTAVLLSVCLVLLFSLCQAQKDLVSNAFGSHMVLQRAPESANIFGWVKSATPETVSVSLNAVLIAQVLSNSNREWLASLPPQPASGPFTITVSSPSSGTVTIEDVYFGDVFLCSGQSNMQQTVDVCYNASLNIAEAQKYPQIRVFTVGQGTTSETPLDEFNSINQRWSVGSSQSVGGPSWSYFSALCWFEAVQLYNQHKVPLGMISSNWGGTFIQAWSSPAALRKCGLDTTASIVGNDQSSKRKDAITSPVVMDVVKSVNFSHRGVGQPDPNTPSVLYNAMIYPLRFVRIRAALWYQGESNVGNSNYYACAFPAMIEDWNTLFDMKQIPFAFYFVQLSPWDSAGSGTAIADLRQSQLAALTLPRVGFTTAADLGDIDSPVGSIHPRDKETLGVRLALSTRAISYGENVVYLGPVAASFKVAQQEGTKVIVEVSFYAATLGSGLMFKEASCPARIVGTGQCGWYELQRSGDGLWLNATEQEIAPDSKSLFIASSMWESGRTVEGVRYAYSTWPVCTLYNKEDLPAIPFDLKRTL